MYQHTVLRHILYEYIFLRKGEVWLFHGITLTVVLKYGETNEWAINACVPFTNCVYKKRTSEHWLFYGYSVWLDVNINPAYWFKWTCMDMKATITMLCETENKVRHALKCHHGIISQILQEKVWPVCTWWLWLGPWFTANWWGPWYRAITTATFVVVFWLIWLNIPHNHALSVIFLLSLSFNGNVNR